MNTSRPATPVRARRDGRLRSTFIAGGAAVAVILGVGLVAAPASAAEPVASIGESLPAPGPVGPVGSGFTETIVPETHPLELPTPQSSAQNLSRQGKVAPTSTASISGVVSSAQSGQPEEGVEATAVLYDDNGDVKFLSQVTTGSDGSYTIPDLAAADYWLVFHDPASGSESVQWWDSSISNPYGNAVSVSDGQAAQAYWALSPTAIVQGVVTCEGCSQAPDPAQTVVTIDIKNPAQENNWLRVAVIRPDADGNYISYALYPNDGTYTSYVTFAFNSGLAGHSPQSNSQIYVLAPNTSVAENVIISKLITPIPGLDDQYAQVGNAIVNALYTDFLNRTPSVGEASGWVLALYNGADPSSITAGFVNSDEYRLIRIDAAYQSILGRPSEPAGRLNWLNAMRAGAITTDQIETSLYASQEYFLAHGGTNISFAKALYSTLLHRTGASSDWSFWADLVARHGRDWVIAQFWDSHETISERVSLMYQQYLGRVPDADGLQSWVNIALAIGDSGLRSGLTSSDEYLVRSTYRFSEV
ncbi:MAG: hypothetical protein JWQ64_2154 [Subtercola sp.]|nr:hypothetical protein [Subtercola sp.]